MPPKLSIRPAKISVGATTSPNLRVEGSSGITRLTLVTTKTLVW